MAKIIKNEDKYYFDAEDGTQPVECRTFLEKSKANDKNQEGKLWIVLPKDNCINRQYFSVNKFETENVDGELSVEVNIRAPRTLGAAGVKQTIIKYLNEENAAEYTGIVEDAVEKFKALRANRKPLKLEDMTKEQLEAAIAALENGETYKIVNTNAPKSFIDCMDEADYNRYNELLAIAMENKANRPKVARGPLTEEQKAERKNAKRKVELSKAKALLAAMMAIQDNE